MEGHKRTLNLLFQGLMLVGVFWASAAAWQEVKCLSLPWELGFCTRAVPQCPARRATPPPGLRGGPVTHYLFNSVWMAQIELMSWRLCVLQVPFGSFPGPQLGTSFLGQLISTEHNGPCHWWERRADLRAVPREWPLLEVSIMIHSCPFCWRAERDQRCGPRVRVLPLGSGSAILPMPFCLASDVELLWASFIALLCYCCKFNTYYGSEEWTRDNFPPSELG